MDSSALSFWCGAARAAPSVPSPPPASAAGLTSPTPPLSPPPPQARDGLPGGSVRAAADPGDAVGEAAPEQGKGHPEGDAQLPLGDGGAQGGPLRYRHQAAAVSGGWQRPARADAVAGWRRRTDTDRCGRRRWEQGADGAVLCCCPSPLCVASWARRRCCAGSRPAEAAAQRAPSSPHGRRRGENNTAIQEEGTKCVTMNAVYCCRSSSCRLMHHPPPPG